MLNMTCICGSLFKAYPSDIKRGRKYCSRACQPKTDSYTKTCKKCSEVFSSRSPGAKYCSGECLAFSKGSSQCNFCTKEFAIRHVGNGETNEYCSKDCHYKFKQFTPKKDASGKVRISVPVGYPGRMKDGRISLSRYIMQEHLGRSLLKGERVYTKNNNKGDLRLENLYIVETVSGLMPNGIRMYDGYIVETAHKNSPGARKNGTILQHRRVMQESLGRPLELHETVHHKNGDRADNRIENLELWKGNHGKGIRESDYHCAGCNCI